MENKHSDLTITVEDIEYRLADVNKQMDSFSVDMSSALKKKTIKEVKGKQSEKETKIKSNEDTFKIDNERVHRFSNITKVLRGETERLDYVSASRLNRKMKSNDKKIIEVNRKLYSDSKKVNDQIKKLENNIPKLQLMSHDAEEKQDKVDGMFNVINKRLVDGVDGMLIVINADLHDIMGFAVFLAAYEKLVSKQLRTVNSTVPAEVTNGHTLESGPNK